MENISQIFKNPLYSIIDKNHLVQMLKPELL